MATRLNMICHASTAALRTSAFPADEPLDSHGRKKLASLPHRVHSADLYLTSPALPARQSAEALKLPVDVEPMIRECDYGRWAGRAFEDVLAKEPEAITQWLRDPAAAPHGGESVLALIARVAKWLDALAATSQKIVAVTHASVIRAAIVHAIEAPPHSFWRIDVAPLSLARLSGDDGRWNLVSLGALEPESVGP